MAIDMSNPTLLLSELDCSIWSSVDLDLVEQATVKIASAIQSDPYFNQFFPSVGAPTLADILFKLCNVSDLSKYSKTLTSAAYSAEDLSQYIDMRTYEDELSDGAVHAAEDARAELHRYLKEFFDEYKANNNQNRT